MPYLTVPLCQTAVGHMTKPFRPQPGIAPPRQKRRRSPPASGRADLSRVASRLLAPLQAGAPRDCRVNQRRIRDVAGRSERHSAPARRRQLGGEVSRISPRSADSWAEK